LQVRQRLARDPRAFIKLTPREQEVLEVLGGGLNNTAAGKELKMSPSRVQQLRVQIMRKLGLHHTTDLIRYAVVKGFAKLKAFRH
jgi:DNA-binding NarL/FixJ family response regulator